MQDFWPACGYRFLTRNAQGRLSPGEAYLRWLLARPELALQPESCAAEIALHEALQREPSRPVAAAEFDRLADADARDNWRMFLAFRDALLGAGTLEAFVLGLFRSGRITIPPLFIDLVVQALLRHLLDDCDNAFDARAAEMLFRPQRVTVRDGRVIAGDRETLDHLEQTGGFGDLGRLLKQADALPRNAALQVLSTDNQAEYWRDGERHRFLLDLTHSIAKPLTQGLNVALTNSQSGLAALARVLERWVAHLLGVAATITPQPRIDDAAWRWHIGLDAEASAILDDLYLDRPVEPARAQRLVGLFTLRFAEPAEMRADLAGKPVYLGLAIAEDGSLRVKPQNLLLNLPLARAS